MALVLNTSLALPSISQHPRGPSSKCILVADGTAAEGGEDEQAALLAWRYLKPQILPLSLFSLPLQSPGQACCGWATRRKESTDAVKRRARAQ